jgi:predicted DNA-binding protein (UPF0251 family)
VGKIKLSAERVAQLRQAQRQLHDILPEMDAAEQCGIECQQFRSLVQEAQNKITNLLTHFGTPGHSNPGS